MTTIKRLHHVGITVSDLDAAVAFFVVLGLEEEGRTFVEGEFLDTVCGIPGCRTEVVMLRPVGGGPGIELGRFVRPGHTIGTPAPMATEVGLRNVCFEVTDLHECVDRLTDLGYGLVGGIGRLEGAWLMAYVRGPDGVVVAVAQRVVDSNT